MYYEKKNKCSPYHSTIQSKYLEPLLVLIGHPTNIHYPMDSANI